MWINHLVDQMNIKILPLFVPEISQHCTQFDLLFTNLSWIYSMFSRSINPTLTNVLVIKRKYKIIVSYAWPLHAGCLWNLRLSFFKHKPRDLLVFWYRPSRSVGQNKCLLRSEPAIFKKLRFILQMSYTLYANNADFMVKIHVETDYQKSSF